MTILTRLVLFLIVLTLISCAPAVTKTSEKEEETKVAQKGVDENFIFPTTFGNVRSDELKAATINLYKYSDGGRLDTTSTDKIQSLNETNQTFDQVLTHIATTNKWEIFAAQEILDQRDANGKFNNEPGGVAGRDPDFPDVKGYTLLKGGVIKDWYKGKRKKQEYCAIYVKTNGKISKCENSQNVTTGNSQVHWEECSVKKTNRKFLFGCGHFSFGNVAVEVNLIADWIKNEIDTATTGQKVEFILGMDSNAFHKRSSRNYTAWSDDFANKVPSATLADFPVNEQTVTKISKKGTKYGPPKNPSFQIYDWLVFNVKKTLKYKNGSMRVPPVVNQLDYPGSNSVKKKTKHKRFKKAWYKSFSDHLPAEAVFKIVTN